MATARFIVEIKDAHEKRLPTIDDIRDAVTDIIDVDSELMIEIPGHRYLIVNNPPSNRDG